ncbi:hypothetical protein PVAP13_9KG386350, partial [Panicum virgatum]
PHHRLAPHQPTPRRRTRSAPTPTTIPRSTASPAPPLRGLPACQLATAGLSPTLPPPIGRPRPAPTTACRPNRNQRPPCRRPGSPRRHIPLPLGARFHSAGQFADSIAFSGSVCSGFWLRWKMRKARGVEGQSGVLQGRRLPVCGKHMQR